MSSWKTPKPPKVPSQYWINRFMTGASMFFSKPVSDKSFSGTRVENDHVRALRANDIYDFDHKLGRYSKANASDEDTMQLKPEVNVDPNTLNPVKQENNSNG